jgi:hypothetical protein
VEQTCDFGRHGKGQILGINSGDPVRFLNVVGRARLNEIKCFKMTKCKGLPAVGWLILYADIATLKQGPQTDYLLLYHKLVGFRCSATSRS